jgi:cobalamin biosynthetic protein CobC
VERRELLELAAQLRRRGGLLVVDEAFMDVAPRAERVQGPGSTALLKTEGRCSGGTIAGDVEVGDIVVLKSFGKFFGLAGVRLGFAIASRSTAQWLEQALGPWAVSGTALEYGLNALADAQWQSTMRVHLAAEADALDALLARHGIVVEGGTALFRFVEHPAAAHIFDCLGRNGILVRRFDRLPNCLRFGLPAGEAETARLDAALTAWAKSRDERA